VDSVVISHPEKVLFPDEGITKGELAAYYESIAPLMLPHLRKRPVTMERFHRGIGDAGFIQKTIGKGTPDWIERVEVPKKGGTVTHPLINDTRSLLWLANQNCITPHVWVSRVPHLYHPDVCIIDLDPLQDDIVALRTAALSVRDLLGELGLTSWVKTSGSKGFHVAVPLNGKADAGDVSTFAGAVGRILVDRFPKQLTQEFSKADREGRIYVDTGRNHPPATFAAAYAVRPKPGAPVSAPCTWDEIEKGNAEPRTFTIRNMPARVAKVGDLWSTLHEKPQSLASILKTLRDKS
jgi:bifunctional non-homologous end joining protein LigD